MDKGRSYEYEMLAIRTTIKWCKEQGVKIFLSDFNYNHTVYNGYRKEFQFHTQVETFEQNVSVLIDFKGRWGKQLKEKKDNFLNYLNVRVTKDDVRFNFTYKELDFIRLSDSSVKSNSDEDDSKIQKVIAKISKLLALADVDKNPSENEAISASLKVQQLLAEYNLSLEQVTGESREEQPIEQAVADVGGSGSKYNWKHQLAYAVANGYACKSFSVGNSSVVFYGYSADVILARRVFVYLFKVGNRLGNQYVSRKSSYSSSEHTLYQSFVTGFVNGVNSQLEKQCTALALVVQPAVEEAWEEFSRDFRTRKRRGKRYEAEAFSEGVIEGKRAFNAQYIEE